MTKESWGQGPKPTKRLAWTELIEGTKHITGGSSSLSLLIGNELSTMQRNRNALTTREIRAIQRLMDLCFKEGIYRGISDRAGATSETDRRHALANASAFGSGADTNERDSDAGAASRDSARPVVHHHGKALPGGRT